MSAMRDFSVAVSELATVIGYGEADEEHLAELERRAWDAYDSLATARSEAV